MSEILSLLDNHAAFEPEATRAMSQAFEEACVSLQIRSTQQREREIIAARIIELARGGVLDVSALRDRVLRESRIAS
jgi:hypothetical protein